MSFNSVLIWFCVFLKQYNLFSFLNQFSLLCIILFQSGFGRQCIHSHHVGTNSEKLEAKAECVERVEPVDPENITKPEENLTNDITEDKLELKEHETVDKKGKDSEKINDKVEDSDDNTNVVNSNSESSSDSDDKLKNNNEKDKMLKEVENSD